MAKTTARTWDSGRGFRCIGTDSPTTFRTMALKTVKRVGAWLSSAKVCRNTVSLAVVGLLFDQLAYSAAWRTAERVLRPQQNIISADDAMTTWFAASLAEVKRKRENHER